MHSEIPSCQGGSGGSPGGQDAAGDEIVESMSGVGESVDDGLRVGPSVGRIDSMAGVEMAQAFEGGVFMVEHLDEDMLEFYNHTQ